MARTINEIHNGMLTAMASDEVLAVQLTSTSKVAVFRLFSFIVASSIWILEKLFDTHKTELTKMLFEQKSGTLPWYRTMALNFQYGFDLVVDSDRFNNGVATIEQIEASKIVKYAAVSEGLQDSRVIIKIAGETDGVLAPITNAQHSAFDEYIDEVRFAGVKVTVINYLPDRLYLTIQIYRDPLLLDENGNSILNGGNPVETAIKEFMKELPFDGQLVLAHLTDKLQLVDGVKIPNIVAVQSSWIDPAINGYGTPQPINVRAIPESGYYEIINFDNITYVV